LTDDEKAVLDKAKNQGSGTLSPAEKRLLKQALKKLRTGEKYRGERNRQKRQSNFDIGVPSPQAVWAGTCAVTVAVVGAILYAAAQAEQAVAPAL
jgi:hypothetical protein